MTPVVLESFTVNVRRCLWPAMVSLLLIGPACGSGGGAGPTSPPRSAFGALGASLTWIALEGYESIGGARGWPYEELVPYGGAGISRWEVEIGQPGSTLWGIFESLLQAEPGTSEIWWHILVGFRSGPPPTVLSPSDQHLVIRVGREIRRLVGPGIPIYASPFPDYGPSTGCTEIPQASIQASKLMVDFAIANGLAEPGPSLRPITGQNNGGPRDPCHQGPVGRRQHGEDLRRFFGG